MPKAYQDKKGFVYFVGDGISRGEDFMTLKQKIGPGHGTHRVVSRSLPLRKSIVAAQADLDIWAEKKGLKPREME